MFDRFIFYILDRRTFVSPVPSYPIHLSRVQSRTRFSKDRLQYDISLLLLYVILYSIGGKLLVYTSRIIIKEIKVIILV